MKAQYMNHMGDDLMVANVARVSFDKVSEWGRGVCNCDGPDEDGIHYALCTYYDKVLKTADANLIKFLARGCSTGDWEELVEQFYLKNFFEVEQVEELLKHVKRMPTHWTPFAHPQVTLRMNAPIPIRTQCFKHKQGFVENEESRRYISSRPVLFVPEFFRAKPEGSIKQGSGDKHPFSDYWLERYKGNCEYQINLYETMVKEGICPEQARFILPQGVEVKWVWTGSLAAFARFYQQRTDSHAQLESSILATQVGDIIRPLFPVSWEALTV